MTYETNQNPSGDALGRHDDDRYFWWAKTPGINPFKVLAVIAGFAIFPPLGIGVLVYFLWKERQWRRGSGSYGYQPAWNRGGGCGGRYKARTGNSAFDEHSSKILKDLEDERQAFTDYRAKQRQEQDRQTFDEFKSKRGETPAADAEKPQGE